MNSWTFGSEPCCATAITLLPKAQGSRRRRLWELAARAHCPVVGVCLPLAALRRIAARVAGSWSIDDDYALHSEVVGACAVRSPMAEQLQRELEQRFALRIQQAARLKTAGALREWWPVQSDGPGLAGALWALVTHPRCDDALEQAVLGDVHMRQHQVGAAVRVDLARFETALTRAAELQRELAQAQQRLTSQGEEQARRHESLLADGMRLRAELIERDTRIAALTQELQALREQAPGLARQLTLTQQLAERNEQLLAARRELTALRGEAQRARLAVPALPRPAPAATTTPAPEARPVELADRAVLCVGGRTGSVPLYRSVVERSGARFLHHDGGDEQSGAQLDATLRRADLVLCQIGCVSHGAVWRVKDHCRRTGKPCVFVDGPSVAQLERALAAAGGEAR